MKRPNHNESEFLLAIAGEIKARRINLDLSIRDAAKVAGIPQSAWWALENKGNPTAVTLYRIAAALRCEPCDLLP